MPHFGTNQIAWLSRNLPMGFLTAAFVLGEGFWMQAVGQPLSSGYWILANFSGLMLGTLVSSWLKP